MAQIAKRSIPFSGKYNTRISSSNPVTSTTAIAGFAVAGIMIAGNQSTPVDKDERWINCFLTKEGSDEYIVKRPGAASLNTPQAGSHSRLDREFIENNVLLRGGKFNAL